MPENNFINVGGRLHSIATGNNLVGANEVFDDDKNKKQSIINTETDTRVTTVETDLNASSSGLKARVHTLEEQVAFDGEFEVANNPEDIVSGSGKITSANAVSGAVNAINASIGFFECNTGGDVADKVVDAPGFVLRGGGSIKIQMKYRNTANNVTLNINSTGAKPLYYNGYTAWSYNTWKAGETIEVYYDDGAYSDYYFGRSLKYDSGIFILDVSQDNVEGVTRKTYDSLSQALNDIAIFKRKSGMTIRYIDSTTNKYEQCRYLLEYANTTAGNNDFVNVDNWTKGDGDGVLDVSAKYPTSGVEGGNTYTLEGALSVLNTNLPASKKKGGMSIKFVQTSDNKYVQYMYVGTSIATDDFTNENNWQKINVEDEVKQLEETTTSIEQELGKEAETIEFALTEKATNCPENIGGQSISIPYDSVHPIREAVGTLKKIVWDEPLSTTDNTTLNIIKAKITVDNGVVTSGTTVIVSDSVTVAANANEIDLSSLDWTINTDEYIGVWVPSGSRGGKWKTGSVNTALSGFTFIGSLSLSNALVNFNAVIEYSRDVYTRLSGIEAQVDELNDDVERVEGTVEGFSADIDLLKEEVNGEVVTVLLEPSWVLNDILNDTGGLAGMGALVPCASNVYDLRGIDTKYIKVQSDFDSTSRIKYALYSKYNSSTPFVLGTECIGVGPKTTPLNEVVDCTGAEMLIIVGLPDTTKQADKYYPAKSLNGKIGDLDTLSTTNKDSAVDAINEVNARLGFIPSAFLGKFNGKKIAIIGDSISTFSGYLPSDISGYDGTTYATMYPFGDVSSVNDCWWAIMAQQLGLNINTDVMNCSWSTSTVCGNSESTNTAKPACSDRRIADLSLKGTPDIVICYIGVNDWSYGNALGTWKPSDAIPSEGDITSFKEAYALMINKIHLNYPYARIFCCTFLDIYNIEGDIPRGWPQNTIGGTVAHDFNNAIREIGSSLGCDIIELHSCGVNYNNVHSHGGTQQALTIDGIHPNKEGQSIMAHKVITELFCKY